MAARCAWRVTSGRAACCAARRERGGSRRRPRMAEALLTTGSTSRPTSCSTTPRWSRCCAARVDLLPAGADAVRARLLGYLAVEAPNIVDESERRAMVERALVLARRAGDPVAIASALLSHSWVTMGPESRELRLELADELIAGGDAGLPYAVSSGYVFRYVALVEAGDIEGADAALAAARTRPLACPRPAGPRACGPAPGWCSPAGSRRRSRRPSAPPSWPVRAASRRASSPARSHRRCGASACSRAASPSSQPLMMDRLERLPDRPAWTYIYEAIVECELGRHDAASAALDMAFARGLEHAPRGLAWPSSMIWAADVCEQVGHAEGAARLHELLSPLEGVMVSYAGPMSVSLARLAVTLGRPEEARRHYRDSVALCERMDARAYLAIARRELGQLTWCRPRRVRPCLPRSRHGRGRARPTLAPGRRRQASIRLSASS